MTDQIHAAIANLTTQRHDLSPIPVTFNGRKETEGVCRQCGGAIPVVPVGRPRKFCGERCAREWANTTKRLDRELAGLRMELEAVSGAAEPSDPNLDIRRQRATTLRLRREALAVEVDKRTERRELRRRGIDA